MTKFYAPFLSSVVRAAVLAAAIAFTPSAHAALYWDANSALGGNGTWDNDTTQNWSTVNAAVAPNSKWTPNDGTVDAVFNGPDAPGYTVTIGTGTTMSAKSVSFGIAATTTARNVIITGGTLNITDPNNSIVMNLNTSGIARQQVIQSALTGTDITVSAGNAVGGFNTFLGLGASGTGATNTFTGNLIFAGPSTANSGFLQIGFNNPTASGPSGGSFAGTVTNTTIKMRRNLSQLLFGGGGPPGTNAFIATFNNNIILNDGQSGTLTQSIGAGSGQAGTAVTLGGVISGNASLGIQLGAAGGGQGTIVLANHSTYTGSTDFNTAAVGVLRLAINDALPTGTTFNFNRGTFDMAGFSQKIAGLNSTSDGSANPIKNTGATKSTLTIDGNVTGTFGGTTISGAGGIYDNTELVLASTNTGALSLTKPNGNTYTGGTTINGGKLIAASFPSSSATGTGTVTVNNNGTLGGGGGVGDPTTGLVTVASGGHLSPTNDSYDGTVQKTTGAVGALSVLGNLTLASGARLDMDLGAPVFGASGTSDQVNMPNATALNVPAAANSVGLNFGNPNGLGGNGTYTLMTFQAGQYTGSSNASQFYTVSSPSPNNINGATVTYHLADSSNNIVDGTPTSATRVIAVVTGGSNQLTWAGNNGTAWDTGTTANFNTATTGTGSLFASNDNVLFDDSAGANTTVAVDAGGVQPNMVVISNSSGTYTFSGGDINGSSLGGGGALFLSGTGAATINNNYTVSGPITSNKTGNGTATFNGNITAVTALTVNGGTVTLAGANTYTGSNTINGGTLSVAADNNLGAAPGSPTAGSIVIAGGTLKTTAGFTLSTNRSITATGTATISNDPSTTLSYGGVVSGNGSLVQTGGGKLVLSGANTYTGNTVVRSTATGDNSTLAIGADNALPTGTQLNINGVTAAGSATFDLGGFNQTVAGIALTGPAGSSGTITNSASGTAKNFTVTNSSSSFAGTISGNLNLIKNGVDTLTLPGTGSFSYTGDTKVLGGALNINSAYLADAADVYLATGALFNLNFIGSDTIRSLFIDGIGQVTGTWGGTGSGAAHITPLITSTGLLNVITAASLPGDYNNDGKVNAADYVTWRKGGSPNPNSIGDYNTSPPNYGNGGAGSGSGLGGSSAVPEPASCGLLLIGCAALMCNRRKRAGRAAV